MRSFVALAVAAALAGCAVAERRAARLTSPALCYVYYAGNAQDKAVSSAELAKRGFTCSQNDILMGQQDFARAQAAEQSRSDAAAAAGLYLLTPRPAAVPPKPIQCYTTGDGRTTTCY